MDTQTIQSTIDAIAPTTTFTRFSDRRVDSLAFATDGSLWGTSWDTRGDILKFNPGTGLASAVLSNE